MIQLALAFYMGLGLNAALLPIGQLPRSPATSDMVNNSMAILLDVNWYMPSQKLGAVADLEI